MSHCQTEQKQPAWKSNNRQTKEWDDLPLSVLNSGG